MKQHDQNPLRFSKKTSFQHPNHKRKAVACKYCNNDMMFEQNTPLPCVNCGLFCLRLVTSDLPEGWAEYYCSACHTHWGRTNNW